MKMCSTDGCNLKHLARGFCQKHHSRWRRYGDPLYFPDPEETKRKHLEAMNHPDVKKKTSVGQFKKGSIPHNKGKKATAEEKKKMSKAMNRPEVKKKLSESKMGAKNPMYGKPSHNRGKSPSLETLKKMSESQKKLVRFYSKEERERRSKRAKKWFAIHGSNRKGIKDTPETFKKKSLAQKGKKKSKEHKEKIALANRGKIRTHEARAKISAARAKQKFPYKDTKIELITQSILEENNIIFKKHKNYKLSESNHQADITIEPDKIIEVNGDYWHFNPKIYHAESTQKLRNQSILAKEKWVYDKYVIDGMKQQGYKVLVVWESELKNELDKTTKKILKFAKS